jgi:hypothetical protein
MEIPLRITNTSKEVVSYPWVIALLNSDERLALEEFKKTPAYLGNTKEEEFQRRRMPEAMKLKPFMNKLGRGVMFEEFYKERISEREAITRSELVLRWCLGPNYEEIRKDERGLYVARDLCQRHGILFSAADSLDTLIEKIKAKFGDYRTVLTNVQYRDSGLEKGLGRKEIRQRATLTSPATVMYSGLLVSEEILPGEEAIPTEVEPATTPDLDSMSRKELEALAIERGVKYVAVATANLIESLRA